MGSDAGPVATQFVTVAPATRGRTRSRRAGQHRRGGGFPAALATFAVVQRYYRAVMNVGWVLLIAVGLLLVSGIWNQIIESMRGLIAGYGASP